MQKLLNHIMRRNVSTERVDNMVADQALIALDKRVIRMLAAHSAQPAPQSRHFEVLSNPIQKHAIT